MKSDVGALGRGRIRRRTFTGVADIVNAVEVCLELGSRRCNVWTVGNGAVLPSTSSGVTSQNDGSWAMMLQGCREVEVQPRSAFLQERSFFGSLTLI